MVDAVKYPIALVCAQGVDGLYGARAFPLWKLLEKGQYTLKTRDQMLAVNKKSEVLNGVLAMTSTRR